MRAFFAVILTLIAGMGIFGAIGALRLSDDGGAMFAGGIGCAAALSAYLLLRRRQEKAP